MTENTVRFPYLKIVNVKILDRDTFLKLRSSHLEALEKLLDINVIFRYIYKSGKGAFWVPMRSGFR